MGNIRLRIITISGQFVNRQNFVKWLLTVRQFTTGAELASIKCFRTLSAPVPDSERLDGCMAKAICRPVLAC